MNKAFSIGAIWLSVIVFLTTTLPVSADVSQLRSYVARKAGALSLLHQKAEKALVTAAQDVTFRQYFEAKTNAERMRLRNRIDRIGLAVQKRFAVEEMCLIDPSGTEISRIVGRQIAYDLSTEEASANFFAPTFAAEPRHVHMAPIYMSPDAHRWVVAYATPVVADGKKEAILHYEHGLNFYETTLNSGVDPKGERVLLTVTSDGFVIFDSRKSIPIAQKGESEEASDYFETFSLANRKLDDLKRELHEENGEAAGTIATDGKQIDVALKQIGDWTLIVFEPHKAQSAAN
jgi:hypothetical protein